MSLLSLSASSAPAPSVASQVPEADKLKQQINELYRAGKYSEAIPIARRLLELREKTLGQEHPNTATSLNNLALLYKAMGDYAKAEPLYQRALKIREKALGPEHPGTATTLDSLAALYYATGHYAKAEPFYQRALKIKEKALGPDHPDTVTALSNLALLKLDCGEAKNAFLCQSVRNRRTKNICSIFFHSPRNNSAWHFRKQPTRTICPPL